LISSGKVIVVKPVYRKIMKQQKAEYVNVRTLDATRVLPKDGVIWERTKLPEGGFLYKSSDGQVSSTKPAILQISPEIYALLGVPYHNAGAAKT
jgi:hypothetical protein